MICSRKNIPNSGRYVNYDLIDGHIWLYNKMNTKAGVAYRFEDKTLILKAKTQKSSEEIKH
ncbi:MAG: hypothetical protein JXR27_03720 [Paludibacteraceae bacterium]|nr:hypothetical protein [Paludibacteraceae bacterium]